MNGYAPLVGMVVLGAFFVLATIAVNVVLAVKRPNRAKHEIYAVSYTHLTLPTILLV